MQYQVSNELGTGNHGSVFLCVYENGAKFALKRINCPTIYQREFDILKALRGAKHIVQLEEDSISVGINEIALRYYPHGELFSFIERKGSLDEVLAKVLIKQCLIGLQEMHSRGFAHQDIKPDNIFIDHHYQVVIGDMSFGQRIGNLSCEIGGTISYMSPEVLEAFKDSTRALMFDRTKSDVWSVGVVLFFMLTGNAPFGIDGPTPSDWYIRVINANKWPRFWDHHDKHSLQAISIEAKLFIQRILQIDPNLRPSVGELLMDPYLSSCAGESLMPQEEYIRVMEVINNMVAA